MFTTTKRGVRGGTVVTLAAALATSAVAVSPARADATQAARGGSSGAAASSTARTSIDMDGDGRADRTTFTKVRSTRDHHVFRLATRTARGRTASTLVYAPNNIDETGAADVWVGAAGVDGVRGGEIVVDLMGGVGDATHHVVYTMRSGRFTTLRAPGARSGRTAWNVVYFPGVWAGYRFSSSGGVRRVTATTVTPMNAYPPYTGYTATRTTYRWTASGWARSGSVRLTRLPEKAASSYAGWNGLIWR